MGYFSGLLDAAPAAQDQASLMSPFEAAADRVRQAQRPSGGRKESLPQPIRDFNGQPVTDRAPEDYLNDLKDPETRAQLIDQVAPLAMSMSPGPTGLAGKGRIPSSSMKSPDELYHVAGPEYQPGQPLRSLYSRMGEQAYDAYAQRWPEAGDLGQYHAHTVFFYDKLPDALSHADAFGGTVLRVDPSKVPELFFDRLESGHPAGGFYATREAVPPEALTPLR